MNLNSIQKAQFFDTLINYLHRITSHKLIYKFQFYDLYDINFTYNIKINGY